MQPLKPEKLFYKIGEVAHVVGVPAHVLRYWENEFALVRPMKTRGSHRVYRRKDVELLVLIRRLLHDEGYTVAGARKQLRQLGRAQDAELPARKAASRETELRGELLELRTQLSGLLQTLDDLSIAEPASTLVEHEYVEVTRHSR